MRTRLTAMKVAALLIPVLATLLAVMIATAAVPAAAQDAPTVTIIAHENPGDAELFERIEAGMAEAGNDPAGSQVAEYGIVVGAVAR